ncbi:DUF4870 domain-containing protein [Patescibacteria group bacterium]|nr:DUF4870 domain-containing protein [Patescibacteria group bacterium]
MPEEIKPEENNEEQTETKTETPQAEGSGLDPNVAALLAYLFLWVGGLIFFLIEKENKFVRFAAMQSILFNVAVLAFYFVISIITRFTIEFVGLLLPLVLLGSLVLWIMLMFKAYQNQEWELPIIGKIARDVINK